MKDVVDSVKFECETCSGVVYIPQENQEEGMVCPSCETGTIRPTWYGTVRFET